jgi:hypothetical protein
LKIYYFYTIYTLLNKEKKLRFLCSNLLNWVSELWRRQQQPRIRHSTQSGQRQCRTRWRRFHYQEGWRRIWKIGAMPKDGRLVHIQYYTVYFKQGAETPFLSVMMIVRVPWRDFAENTMRIKYGLVWRKMQIFSKTSDFGKTQKYRRLSGTL